MDRILVIVRHGQSEWNSKNLFTGWKNPDLTELGIEEARRAGRELKKLDILFSIGFTSALVRAEHTLKLIFEELGQTGVPTVRDRALNERHYGDLSGLNKDEAREQWGEEQVRLWRRSYDVAPPGGESLKDTVARVLPFYCQRILPPVMRGERVLVTAHGNSLRALAMVLDQLTPESVPTLELATGVPIVYKLNADSTVGVEDRVGWLKSRRLVIRLRQCLKSLRASYCIAAFSTLRRRKRLRSKSRRSSLKRPSSRRACPSPAPPCRCA